MCPYRILLWSFGCKYRALLWAESSPHSVLLFGAVFETSLPDGALPAYEACYRVIKFWCIRFEWREPEVDVLPFAESLVPPVPVKRFQRRYGFDCLIDFAPSTSDGSMRPTVTSASSSCLFNLRSVMRFHCALVRVSLRISSLQTMVLL